MEKSVIFRDRQEVQATDFNNIAGYGRASMDHVVADAIQNGKSWTDFTVTRTAIAQVTVSAGRLYNAGAVYVSEADTVFDLLTDLPGANSRWVAIVTWGQDVDEDTQPRSFLIDATANTTEAQAVAMRSVRKANIGTVVGVAAPQPAKPTVDASNVIVAWVLLNTTDVVSVTLNEDARLPRLIEEQARVDDLEAWRALIGVRVDGLASDMARLRAELGATAKSRLLDQMAMDVARLKEAAELEDAYTDYGADRFLDTTETDTGDVNLLTKVEEGVRFDDEAAQAEALQIFNPLNPDVVISNGFLLPLYTEQKRFKVDVWNEEHSISQYQYQTHNMVQRTVSRQRIRYGETITVCTNSAWFRSGRYDAAQNVFYKAGDTWEVISGHPGVNHTAVRLRRFWVDTYDESYWDRIVINHAISGQQIGQTFLNPQDAWLTSIGLYFTQAGATGNVHVAIAQVTESGTPDLNNLLNVVTLDVADIEAAADGSTETKVVFPATFLEAGKRYAILLTTGGNHYVGMASGTEYAQGTFFYSVDGAYQQGTAEKDLMFSLYFANFAKTRTVVDLQPLSLSGGIAAIDILAPLIRPGSTELTFEIQVSGVWTPLGDVVSGNTVLFGLPALLPFRAVFVGTTDVQSGINLTDSVLKYNRARTTFKHISTGYTLAAPTQSFKVVAVIENFYETNHDLTCTIQADGAGGEISPASVVDVELDPPLDPRDANHKRIRRTWTWTATEITAAMSSVRITMDGATTSALDTFHVAERTHLAF